MNSHTILPFLKHNVVFLSIIKVTQLLIYVVQKTNNQYHHQLKYVETLYLKPVMIVVAAVI